MTEDTRPAALETETLDARDAQGRYVRQPETVERDAQALALRARGKTYAQIAQALGYADKGAAYKAVQRGLSTPLQEPAAELRALEVERLDRMTEAVWGVLENEHLTVSHGRVVMHDGKPLADDGPVLAAVDRLLRIAERRAKLLGLDSPTQARVDGQITYEVVGVEGADLV